VQVRFAQHDRASLAQSSYCIRRTALIVLVQADGGVVTPATSMLSFTTMGSPSSVGRRPRRRRLSTREASFSARSAVTVMSALRPALARPILSRNASVISTTLTSDRFEGSSISRDRSSSVSTAIPIEI
jgi:hypothetical protein